MILSSFVLTAALGAADPQIIAAIETAAAGAHRSAENIARNRYRHPVATLSFFGLEPDLTVVEISPGGGWYTEVLAPVLHDDGKLIAAHYDPDVEGQPDYRYRQVTRAKQTYAENPGVYGNVSWAKFSPPDSIDLGAPESADLVLTFRNNHGWLNGGYAEQVYQAFYEILKPGGVLGVVQHRAPAGADDSSAEKGYVSEARLVALAEKAGFELVASSEVNANPADTKDYERGVWTLPPSLREGEKNREKYQAIGESDRATLKFRKPE